VQDYAPQTLLIDASALDAPDQDYTRATRRYKRPRQLFTKVWARSEQVRQRAARAVPSYRIEPLPAAPISVDGPTQVFRRSRSGQVSQTSLLHSRRG